MQLIYCHVRATGVKKGLERIKGNLEFYRLWDENNAGRIVAVPGDLEAPRIGIDETQYQELAERLDWIYHNGARVNFAHPYEVLKASNVEGTREILKLASLEKIKPVHFISSLAVFLTDGLTTGQNLWRRHGSQPNRGHIWRIGTEQARSGKNVEQRLRSGHSNNHPPSGLISPAMPIQVSGKPMIWLIYCSKQAF